VETYPTRDRAAMQVEIIRLRRIEAKADSSIRQAVVRRIRELQDQIQEIPPKPEAQENAA
jgi:hypothetical protein